MTHDPQTLAGDAEDRRAALAAAVTIASHRGDTGLTRSDERPHWLDLADAAYRWLRNRDTIRITAVKIIHGIPRPEGTSPVTTTYNLADNDEVTFSLTGQDAKGAAVPLPSGYTASWTLADPDSTGATLTASADTTTAVLAAGVPDSNLMVSVTVTVTNADGSTSTYQGAEAVIVSAGPLATISLVPGSVSPEPAAPASGTSPSGGTTGITPSAGGGTTTPA
jgi:hypothetical protein